MVLTFQRNSIVLNVCALKIIKLIINRCVFLCIILSHLEALVLMWLLHFQLFPSLIFGDWLALYRAWNVANVMKMKLFYILNVSSRTCNLLLNKRGKVPKHKEKCIIQNKRLTQNKKNVRRSRIFFYASVRKSCRKCVACKYAFLEKWRPTKYICLRLLLCYFCYFSEKAIAGYIILNSR